ncbi:hypothetical protein OY671_009299, partial [Metschnikowia pulcherrima]
MSNSSDAVRDESGKDAAVRSVFEPKTSRVDRDEFVNTSSAQTSMESSASVNSVCIGTDGRPRQKGSRDVSVEWSAFRTHTVSRRTRFRLDKVIDRIHAPHQVGHEFPVTDVPDVELGAWSQVVRLAVSVNRGGESIEHYHVVPEFDQTVAGVGADEPGPNGDQDPHQRPPPAARSACTSRYTASVRSAVAVHVNSPARSGPAARSRSPSGPQALTM